MGKPASPCTVTGCGRKNFGRGYCSMHYRRVRNHGSTERPLRPRVPFVNTNGYVYLVTDDGPQLLHRLKMEEQLGRKLIAGESVHHRNGIKTDNEDSNLELWCSWQPKGCRVADLVAFAKDVLARYEPEFIGKQLLATLSLPTPASPPARETR